MKKMDLRVIRTRKMIIEAFVTLIEEKGYASITIQDIANYAMINRATFYAHFKDKQDLYEQIFEYAIDSFASILDVNGLAIGNRIRVEKIELIMTQILKQIKQNPHFFNIA